MSSPRLASAFAVQLPTPINALAHPEHNYCFHFNFLYMSPTKLLSSLRVVTVFLSLISQASQSSAWLQKVTPK